jgi:hypothetical protein
VLCVKKAEEKTRCGGESKIGFCYFERTIDITRKEFRKDITVI